MWGPVGSPERQDSEDAHHPQPQAALQGSQSESAEQLGGAREKRSIREAPRRAKITAFSTGEVATPSTSEMSPSSMAIEVRREREEETSTTMRDDVPAIETSVPRRT